MYSGYKINTSEKENPRRHRGFSFFPLYYQAPSSFRKFLLPNAVSLVCLSITTYKIVALFILSIKHYALLPGTSIQKSSLGHDKKYIGHSYTRAAQAEG
jgi:hypothetical protein